jgi:excisionase family DNA binding protein
MKQKRTRTATRAQRHVANVSVNAPINAASAYAAVPVVGALTLKEAAIYLSVSKPTIHKLLARGILRSNRMTRLHLFPVSELDRVLNEGLV